MAGSVWIWARGGGSLYLQNMGTTKTKILSAIKWTALLLLGAAITTLASVYIFPQVAKVFSHRPEVIVVEQLAGNLPRPDCLVYSFRILPTEPMKKLNMAVTFDHPIYATALRDGWDTSSTAITMTGTITVDSPCTISGNSADRDEALTFDVSSNRHQIFIRGRDSTTTDSQAFFATFYPISTANKFNRNIRVEATYEAFGHDFPARVMLVEQPSGRSQILVE